MYCGNLCSIKIVHAKCTFDMKLILLNISIISLTSKVLIVNENIRDQGLNVFCLTEI